MATPLKIQRIAEALATCVEVQKELKEQLKTYEEEELKLREMMLAALKSSKMDGFKTEMGTTYTRAYRKGYEVTDAPAALKWAVANNCVTLDKRKLPSILDGSGAIPAGIAYKETEFLQVRNEKAE